MDYKFNDWFNVGMRFQYGSGFPLTEAVGINPRIILVDSNGDLIPDAPEIAVRQNRGNGLDEVIYDVNFGTRANRYSSRRPDYHRLDVRLNAKADYWDLDWTFYLDVINVYNHANVINYDYNISNELTLERKATTMFPIVPTLGFIVRF